MKRNLANKIKNILKQEFEYDNMKAVLVKKYNIENDHHKGLIIEIDIDNLSWKMAGILVQK